MKLLIVFHVYRDMPKYSVFERFLVIEQNQIEEGLINKKKW